MVLGKSVDWQSMQLLKGSALSVMQTWLKVAPRQLREPNTKISGQKWRDNSELVN